MDKIDETRGALIDQARPCCNGSCRHVSVSVCLSSLGGFADDYALAVLEKAATQIAGEREWHKGHRSKTCPLVVERAIRTRLVGGPRERAADVLTKEILDDALQEMWDAGAQPPQR